MRVPVARCPVGAVVCIADQCPELYRTERFSKRDQTPGKGRGGALDQRSVPFLLMLPAVQNDGFSVGLGEEICVDMCGQTVLLLCWQIGRRTDR